MLWFRPRSVWTNTNHTCRHRVRSLVFLSLRSRTSSSNTRTRNNGKPLEAAASSTSTTSSSSQSIIGAGPNLDTTKPQAASTASPSTQDSAVSSPSLIEDSSSVSAAHPILSSTPPSTSTTLSNLHNNANDKNSDPESASLLLSSSSSSSTASIIEQSSSYFRNDDNNKSFLKRLEDLWLERSGTYEIVALKESVNEASIAFDQASTQVTCARQHLNECLRQWEQTSGRHLQLLQRRESWTTEDAHTFANLVSKEIQSRNDMEQARQDLATAEEALSKRQLEYMNRMRRRYHEEQIWQDQWRVLGTYGTWTLIVLNTCVFMASQYFLRIRENSRMKAIEELIRENSAAVTLATIQHNYANDKQSKSSSEIVDVADTMNENVTSSNSGDEIERQEELLWEAENELRSQVKKLEQARGVAATVPTQWKERVLWEWEYIQAATSDWWSQVRSTSNAALEQVGVKTHQIVASFPVLEDMPKSPSEVHVPSAIVGASLTGAAVLLVMLIFTPKNR